MWNPYFHRYLIFSRKNADDMWNCFDIGRYLFYPDDRNLQDQFSFPRKSCMRNSYFHLYLVFFFATLQLIWDCNVNIYIYIFIRMFSCNKNVKKAAIFFPQPTETVKIPFWFFRWLFRIRNSDFHINTNFSLQNSSSHIKLIAEDIQLY